MGRASVGGLKPRIEILPHVCGRQSAQGIAGPVLTAEIGISHGFVKQGFEYMQFFRAAKVARIAVEDHAQGVVINQLSAQLCWRSCRQPGMQASQFGHHTRIKAQHQGLNTVGR